jgi:hypothetical protein
MATTDEGFSRSIGKAITAQELTEIGASGLSQNAGKTNEDFLRQLSGARGLANMTEMKENDPVIGGVLHAIEMIIRGVNWSVDAADVDGEGEDEEAGDIAAFVASCMGDMTQTWSDTIAGMLSFLPMGFAVHELVYKVRSGPEADVGSKYDDGMIGWRKMPPRAQASIDEFELDKNGGIQGVYQTSTDGAGKRTFIPVERMLLLRTKTTNPRGRSILRNSFVSWYYKTKIQEIEAIGIERDLSGIPVALVPPRLLSRSATADEVAALTAVKEIVRNIKRDEQEGLVFPLAYDEQGHLAYDLKLMSTGGRRQFDTDAIIQRYDQRMAMALLADFILLGHQAVGTQALSVSKIQLFVDSLSAWLDTLAGVFNQYAIPRLMRVNGLNVAKAPKLMFVAPRNVDLTSLGALLTAMSGAGAMLFPDDDLENEIRTMAGLPKATAEEV